MAHSERYQLNRVSRRCLHNLFYVLVVVSRVVVVALVVVVVGRVVVVVGFVVVVVGAGDVAVELVRTKVTLPVPLTRRLIGPCAPAVYVVITNVIFIA